MPIVCALLTFTIFQVVAMRFPGSRNFRPDHEAKIVNSADHNLLLRQPCTMPLLVLALLEWVGFEVYHSCSHANRPTDLNIRIPMQRTNHRDKNVQIPINSKPTSSQAHHSPAPHHKSYPIPSPSPQPAAPPLSPSPDHLEPNPDPEHA